MLITEPGALLGLCKWLAPGPPALSMEVHTYKFEISWNFKKAGLQADV